MRRRLLPLLLLLPAACGATPAATDGAGAALDVVAYARQCKDELALPGTTLAPWNCLDGVEVPVTVDGRPLDGTSYSELAAGRLGCDRPSWLGQAPCANYGFIQRRDLGPGVVAMLLCRVRAFGSPARLEARRAAYAASRSLADFHALYEFHSLGLIWSNLATGKTCFFDRVGATFGGHLPSPDDERRAELADLPAPGVPDELRPKSGADDAWRRSAREVWAPPHEMVDRDLCIQCHDSGPFKSSPWTQLAVSVPLLAPGVPYRPVGAVLDPWRRSLPLASISTTPVQGEPQLCTSCHRVGSQATCSDHVAYAVGERFPSVVTALAQSWPHRAWMPPGGATSEPEWEARYRAHVNKLSCCCRTPHARGCLRQALDVASLADPVAGDGPESCE